MRYYLEVFGLTLSDFMSSNLTEKKQLTGFQIGFGLLNLKSDFGDLRVLFGCAAAAFLIGLVAVVLGLLGAKNKEANKTLILVNMVAMILVLILVCASFAMHPRPEKIILDSIKELDASYIPEPNIAFFALTLFYNLLLIVVAFLLMVFQPNKKARKEPLGADV